MGRVNKKRLEQLLTEIQSALAFDQPELTASIYGDIIRVKGLFAVLPTPDTSHAVGGALGKYRIEIIFDGNFPENEPVVLELGGEIPRSADYHINPNGTCCLEVWEVWLIKTDDHSVQAFFDGPLRNFFLGQLHKKETGDFPFGEHAHGDPGIIEAYAGVLGCGSNVCIVRNTLNALTHRPPRGHWQCPCGSGKKIRNCCRERLVNIGQKITPQLAKQMLHRITQPR